MEIAGYKIFEKIGSGGMATVYRATQVSLDRQVALKIMRESLVEDASIGNRFLREAKIVAQLSHAHIIPIFDVGISNHQHYIAMEYQPDGDLKAKIKAGVTPAEAFDIIKQIATALDVAHRNNYIHRDVKPANILFNSPNVALLSDFGIARVCGSTTTTTTSGQLAGTPMYMSPEQVQGKQTDKRTDIYSLGVILYEMLTGKPPFEGDSAVTIAIKHLTENPEILTPTLQQYQPILDKMLCKDPSQRWSTGKALVNAINQLQMATPSHSIEYAPATVKTSATVGVKSLLAAAVGLAALTATGVFLWDQPTLRVDNIILQQTVDKVAATDTQPNLKEIAPATAASKALKTTSITNQANINNHNEFNNGNITTKLVSTKNNIEPAHKNMSSSETSNFDRIKTQQILSLITSAADALQEKQFVMAEKDYFAVLAIDSTNSRAKKGLTKISDHYLKLAERAIKKREWDTATKHINKAKLSFKRNKKIAPLAQRVKQEKLLILAELKKQRQDKIQFLKRKQQHEKMLIEKQQAKDNLFNDLLSDASQFLSQASQSTSPLESLNKAQQRYHSAITLDKTNAQLAIFEKRLVRSYIDATLKAISQNAYDRAKILVGQGLQISPIDAELLDYKNKIEHKLDTIRLINNAIAFIDNNLNESTLTLSQLNATLTRYRDTVKIAPQNIALANKRTKIIDEYINASNKAMDGKNFSLVSKIVNSGLKLEPTNPKLIALKQLASDFSKPKNQPSNSAPVITITTF